jgi:hypothetical protein
MRDKCCEGFPASAFGVCEIVDRGEADERPDRAKGRAQEIAWRDCFAACGSKRAKYAETFGALEGDDGVEADQLIFNVND